MPYIKQDAREKFRHVIGELIANPPGDAGELNYLITKLCLNYFNYSKKNYQALNDIIGALEGAKLEMYRRTVAPYEDIKIKENGDVS